MTYRDLYTIIVRSLNRMDERLTGHGERIAYYMMRLMEREPRFSSDDICRMTWTALLHDIGNFQNLDIEDLLKKEFDTSFSHARYGYLFLRYMGPFPEYAKIILYHHSSRSEIAASDMTAEMKWLTNCLLVLDTLDLLAVSHPSDTPAQLFARLDTERCDEAAVQAAKQLFCSPEGCALPPEKMHEAILCRLGRMPVSREMQASVLLLLIRSIDFRSRYSALHCSTVIHICDLLAEYLNVDEESRQPLRMGALLHDLGKIALPSRILDFPGKLQGEDWELMKSHTAVTEELLEGCVDDEVLQIAVRHHETLDGQGYPKGLTGPELTLPQRIAAVADIATALSEERSYKEPFPPEKVVHILEDLCARGKLCPRTVGALKEHQAQIYAEVQRAGRETRALYERIYQEYSKPSPA